MDNATGSTNLILPQAVGYHAPDMVALNHLFRRPWFTRVWSLQEAALAKRSEVLCGGNHLDFEQFIVFNQKCQNDGIGHSKSTLEFIATAVPAKLNNSERFTTSHIHAISKSRGIETKAHQTRTKIFPYSCYSTGFTAVERQTTELNMSMSSSSSDSSN